MKLTQILNDFLWLDLIHALNGADPKQIFTVPTGSPMILRGSHWEQENRQGLLHRSPPIEGSGETRFVVVIDPVYEIRHEFCLFNHYF